MKHRSELVQLQIPNPSTKKNQTYYTYDGYYKEGDRILIHQNRRKIEKRTYTSAALMGMLAYYASRKANMPNIPLQGQRIPTKGLISGVFGYVGSYLLFDSIGTHQAADFQKGIAIGSHHLPLWSNKSSAVNPDRVYFELIDSSNNELSIFHSGLTPQSVEKLIPDKILGQPPAKPTIHEGHGQNH